MLKDNPHYPVMLGAEWYHPNQIPRDNPRLFQKPRDAFNYDDVDGSKSKPIIDTQKAPRPNEKLADPKYKPNLFQEPRDPFFTLESAGHNLKNHYLPTYREPTPVQKSLFATHNREETKYAEKQVPQIDLSRAPRAAVGCQSPIKSERVRLFKVPRETMKYQEIQGSHPSNSYDLNKPPHEIFNVIPNSARIVKLPPLPEVTGSRTKPEVDITKPPRDPFFTVEGSNKQLFKEPREFGWILEDQYKPRPPTHHKDDAPIDPPHRRLFAQPRETMKYAEVKDSHPAPFYPTHKRVSPTFQSAIFA